MSSRMDKHSFDTQNKVGSRTQKNSELYKELTTNRITANIKELDNDNNILEITNFSTPQVNVRHRNTKHENIVFDDKSNNNFYDNIFGEDLENKNYDVNDILNTAKKNRVDDGESDKQKRLRSIEYSILTDLNKDKIKEYHDRKAKGITKEEEEDLEELINTITSNKLRKNIDDELFSDLMPESPDDSLISSNLLDELKNEKLSKMEKEKSLVSDESEEEAIDKSIIDKSFYTHSMDLKKEDLFTNEEFEYDEDELDESFKESKPSVVKIIVIIILSLVVIGIIGFCIYNVI